MNSGDQPQSEQINLALAEFEIWCEENQSTDVECFIKAKSFATDIAELLHQHIRLEAKVFGSSEDTKYDRRLNALSAGSSVGPFRLVQRIDSDQGGMGDVWLAEQSDPINRKVALKLVKETGDSAQLNPRILAERQAMAMMDHPNIARILDAGETAAGQPFFAMEYVNGVPITKYCEQHQLDPNARVRLTIDLCAAIEHAHQKGILHRDIKPSNVLVSKVDGKPIVKVIDFGLAKAWQPGLKLVEENITRFGSVVGSLPWMSPEQAVASPGVDTRTDIYSLGAVLFQLLTGSTPVELDNETDKNLIEVLDSIRQRQPTRPSQKLSDTDATKVEKFSSTCGVSVNDLSNILRNDLDWVITKALANQPQSRYETASALAEDLNRFLNNEPVSAKAPSNSYRIWKFVQRNRVAVAGGSALFVLLTIALVVTIQLLIVSRQRERDQNEALDLYESIASGLTGPYLVELTENEILELTSIDERLTGNDLDQANFGEILGFNLQSTSNLRPSVRKAYLLTRLGLYIHGNGQNKKEALSWYEKAIEAYENLSDADLTFAQRPLAFTTVLNNAGLLLRDLGESANAVKYFERAAAIVEKAISDSSEDTEELKQQLSLILMNYSLVSSPKRNLDRAIEVIESAGPQNARRRSLLAQCLHNRALRSRPNEAQSDLLKSIDLMEQNVRQNPDSVNSLADLSRIYDYMAIVQKERGDTDKASHYAEQAIATIDRLVKLDPDSDFVRLEAAKRYYNQANRVLTAGDAESSLIWYDKAIEQLEKVKPAKRNDKVFWLTHWNRAEALFALGKFDESVPDWNQAVLYYGQFGPSKNSKLPYLRSSRIRCLLESDAVTAIFELDQMGDLTVGNYYGKSVVIYNAASICALVSAQMPDSTQKQDLVDRAIGYLVYLEQQGILAEPQFQSELKSDSELDGIRSDPNFQALLRRLGAN